MRTLFRFLGLLLLEVAFFVPAFGQIDRKSIKAERITTPIRVDGLLTEPPWKTVEEASKFVVYEPDQGKPSRFESRVSVLYDDQALYIGASLYDPAPDSILRELSVRDDFGNADGFAVEMNPYDDGQNAFVFRVSASNVQVDYKSSAQSEDFLWNAVWDSEISFSEQGWFVEMRIPFSSLRFSTLPEQEWGFNFYRNVRRYREGSHWNPVDKGKGSVCSQAGKVTGFKNLSPPLRLSLNPYLSGYYIQDDLQKVKGFSWNGGLDMKLGLSESFTLDMTLIPDFGQTRSDRKVLNLSPYEVYYDENREFFNEGMDLFTKAGLFYSRRIGALPSGYGRVEALGAENERLLENPTLTPMLNASKLTGRTAGKLGIGFFNALTRPTFAILEDTISGKQRKIKTEPFANYNLVVLDQSLGKNSFLNFINTNVMKPETGHLANVTGTAFQFMDGSNQFGISGNAAWSHRRDSSSIPWEDGHLMQLNGGKFNGTFLYYSSLKILTENFDPNDLGYLNRANQIVAYGRVAWRKFEPFGILNDMQAGIEYWKDWLYEGGKKSDQAVELNAYGTFRNYLSWGLYFALHPTASYDYFEPRVAGRFYKRGPSSNLYGWLSSDYRKRLALDFNYSYFENQEGTRSFNAALSPRIRLSDRFMLVLESMINPSLSDFGFYQVQEAGIIFSKRTVRMVSNSISETYIFNNKAYLSLFARHYWSAVDYSTYHQFYLLGDDGKLQDFHNPESVYDENINFLTMDLSFHWNFAPGSFLSLVWKNDVASWGFGNIHQGLGWQFNETVRSPQTNSLSFRLTYYLDYQDVKAWFTAGRERRSGLGSGPNAGSFPSKPGRRQHTNFIFPQF